jgi:uncharacterized protein
MERSGSEETTSNIHLDTVNGGVRFRVWVQPRASRSELAGHRDGALRVRIAAPPVDGEANEELVRFLARRLGVPRRNVQIVSGESGRAKLIQVEGIDAAEAALRLV